MRHSLPLAPQFYVTATQSCPYLDDRKERKLFTALHGSNVDALNNTLSHQGFRRSQNVLYRPACQGCQACFSARIRVADFKPSRSQKRIAKKNADLTRRIASPWSTEDQYNLFRRYLDTRHADGGMADMDMFEYAAMVEETPVKTRVFEYHAPDPVSDYPLRAVCLTDILEDGLSMVYSFYDPDMPEKSLGNYLILDHIQCALETGLPYVYLGYWVPGSPKMGYKANFNALEVYHQGRWVNMHDPDDFAAQAHSDTEDSIAEQVSKMTLPDVRHNLRTP